MPSFGFRFPCVKNRLLCLALVIMLGGVATSQEKPSTDVRASVGDDGTGAVTLTAKGVLPKPPLFFNADVAAKVNVASSAVTHDIQMAIKVLQVHRQFSQ